MRATERSNWAQSRARVVHRVTRRLLVPLAVALLPGCTRGFSDALLVFAPSTMSEVMPALARHYLQSQGLPAGLIRFHFNSSTACAAQIRRGAPADLFISADDRLIIDLAHQGLTEERAYRRLVENRLVLVVGSESHSTITGLADLKHREYRRLAIGNPLTTPVGRYARFALQSLDLWEQVHPRLLTAEHARQVVLYVATGQAEAGLVYASDAAGNRGVRVVEIVPQRHTPNLLASGVVIGKSRHARAALVFLDYLTSPEAASLWAQHGFIPLRAPAEHRGFPAD